MVTDRRQDALRFHLVNNSDLVGDKPWPVDRRPFLYALDQVSGETEYINPPVSQKLALDSVMSAYRLARIGPNLPLATPDLIVSHSNPDWTIAVEYKGYRSLTLLSESELLKGMRYQAEWGSAWLVTTSSKSVRSLYGDGLRSKDLVEKGLDRLRAISKRKAFTPEQRENRGIAKKGIMHLQKHEGENLRCTLLSAEELLDSCASGKPTKGLAARQDLR